MPGFMDVRGLQFSMHKRYRRLLPALLGFALCLGLGIVGWQLPAAAITPQYYTELDFPPLPEIQVPNYERYELSNGLVVYLMEDHELPLVSGTATFRSGERFEPGSQVGLASVMSDVMRLGGTTSVSAEQLNAQLEQKAASVETDIDASAASASFDTLAEDLPDVFSLFADVIQHPAFPPDKIDFVKNQYRGSIARRNDDPDDIAKREFTKLIYGPTSPFARTTEYETLDRISREDVLAFYQGAIRPEQTILGITGDFDTATMKGLIQQYFGSWQPTGQALTVNASEPVTQAQTGTFLVDQPQLTQSYILLGHLGGQLNSPDFVPMSVLNEVLNGFSGRLFNEVRSRQGLAYVVYAFWSARYDYPGTFIGGGQTRSEATVPFIQAVLQEIERVRNNPITTDELNAAKDSVLNSFVFSFQSPDQILSRLIRYEYYGYPSDFIFQFQRAVEATTASQVLEAAQRNLKPEQLVTLVVGNPATINPPLSVLKPDTQVTQIDITIPQS